MKIRCDPEVDALYIRRVVIPACGRQAGMTKRWL